MWSGRAIEQELKVYKIETVPKEKFHKYRPKKVKILAAGYDYGK